MHSNQPDPRNTIGLSSTMRETRYPTEPHRCPCNSRPLANRLSQRRAGATLVETLLALALTGIVLMMINMAIDLNLRTLDSRRADIERALLAQSVLRHMAADLQNAVIYEPIDLSNVPEWSGELPGIDGLGDLDGLGDRDGLDGMEAADSDPLSDDGLGLDDLPSSNTTDIEGSTMPTSVPGLFGNQYELQVDVSHLPRVDQYEAFFTESAEMSFTDIPSDVKTVAYYLNTSLGEMTDASSMEVAGATTSTAMGTGGSGLVRRALDRAITAWAAQSGGLEEQVTSADLLAPEVNYLEFRYFDGNQWLTEWDSQELGGLPVAVEITIGIDPAYGLDAASVDVAQMREMSMTDMSEFMYRLVVRLPTARPLPLDQEFLDMGLLDGGGL
jgi:hypothetical protein